MVDTASLIERRRQILLNTPHLETISDSIASFKTDVPALVRDCKVYFEPVQDLHGYDSPWPAGGGVNIWNEEWESGTINTTTGVDQSSTTKMRSVGYIAVIPNTEYRYICATCTAIMFYYKSDKTYISNFTVPGSRLFTTPEDCYFVRFTPVTAYGNVYNNDISIVLNSSGVTIYTPYSNICPITGWDGVTVTRCGKNLFDSSVLTEQTGWKIVTVISTSGTYTMSTNKAVANDNKLYLFFRKVGSSTLGNNDSVTVNRSATITLAEGESAEVVFRRSEGTAVFSDYWYQIEQGSTPTSYEPYTGTSITIPFPQTIYGGYVDLVKGEVVETWQKIILDGDETPNSGNNYNGNLGTNRYFSIPSTGLGYNAGSGYCETAKFQRGAIWASPDSHIGEFNINTAQLHVVFDNAMVGITSETTSTERSNIIKAWLANNPMTFVLPLATPIIYQLTPQTIKTLKGVNNIWSNANGNIEVKFWKH